MFDGPSLVFLGNSSAIVFELKFVLRCFVFVQQLNLLRLNLGTLKMQSAHFLFLCHIALYLFLVKLSRIVCVCFLAMIIYFFCLFGWFRGLNLS